VGVIMRGGVMHSMKKNKKGFTLAELLIVVAIIGVLVAISIPIFSKQLEKARDATSVANIRSAYAEAMNYAIEYNGYPVAKNPSYYKDGNNKIYVDATGYVSAVVIPITVKSRQANNWSGLADNLPFGLTDTYGKPNASNKPHGDLGEGFNKYKTTYVEFLFDSKKTGDLQYVYIYQG